jgi:hypothetical protein
MTSDDPSTETWRETVALSTSARPTPHLDAVKARLLQTQRDLAASQADLTKALAELAAAQKAEPCAWRGLAEEAMRERETLRIQLAATYQFASAYQPGERSWQVARQDTGIACASCERPIVRGQAFQPLADAEGHFAHVHCPDLKEGS